MDPRAEGTIYPEVSFTVEPQRVAAFREVFGQTQGVPPTFPTAAEFMVLPTIVADPVLALDYTRVVHGSQEYLYGRPLVEGERLTIRSRIASVRVRGSTGILTIEMELVDDAGETVVTARSTMIERGPDG
jgi:acyl dehydratase